MLESTMSFLAAREDGKHPPAKHKPGFPPEEDVAGQPLSRRRSQDHEGEDDRVIDGSQPPGAADRGSVGLPSPSSSSHLSDLDLNLDPDLILDPDLPPPLSCPSEVSSIHFSSPGPGIRSSPPQHSPGASTLPGVDQDAARASRHDLASRLTQLATVLISNDGLAAGELAGGGQLDLLERVVGEMLRPETFELHARSCIASPPASSPIPSSLCRSNSPRQREWRSEMEATGADAIENRPGSGAEVIAEMLKLNHELSAVVGNLRARREESDHIHYLLIERAEQAARRIIFLQNRLAYLERELRDNDDELLQLRIRLKAVEVQMPPHPDEELQRCISTLKGDLKALRKKRPLSELPSSPETAEISLLTSPSHI
ncbi:hypothetical protein RJ55_02406 [Drechmeria coniospora]|nr:hypothetical protein RJ55_02406 [Drechmeria coniospora]